MFGTVINIIAIIIGGLVGSRLRSGINKEYRITIMDGVGLSVLVIGIMSAIKSDNIILLISSLVIGGLIGETVGIEKKLEKFAHILQSNFKKGDSNFSKGFVTASLVFTVGAMAIIGSLEAGIDGNYQVSVK